MKARPSRLQFDRADDFIWQSSAIRSGAEESFSIGTVGHTFPGKRGAWNIAVSCPVITRLKTFFHVSVVKEWILVSKSIAILQDKAFELHSIPCDTNVNELHVTNRNSLSQNDWQVTVSRLCGKRDE